MEWENGTDVMYSPEQLNLIIEHLEKKKGHVHRRNPLYDFSRLQNEKWPMPIKYKFDGSHCK